MNELGAWHYLLSFAGSALLTVLLVPVALRLASGRLRPRSLAAYREQDASVPYIGGAVLVTAFSAVVLVAGWVVPQAELFDQLAGVLGIAVALVAVGLVHDVGSLPMWLRLAATAAAAVALWFVGVRIEIFSSAAPDLLLTVLWVVGITSAFNLLDNIDGLSVGVAGVAAASFFVIAAANGQFLVASLAAALAGCALGFLRHNYFPARVYMGEAGSHFFGFLLAALGIKLRFEGDPTPATYLVPVLVLGVAIFDTALVVLTRLASRRSPLQGARDHISHRLVAAGLPVQAALGVIYLAAFVLGWLALVMSRLQDTLTALLLAGLVLTTGVVVGVFLASTLPMAAPVVGLTPLGAVFKRTFDLVVGVVLAVLATPVILLFALVSSAVLRAWPFFVQERIGRHGRIFRFWKIRTLPKDAPRYALKGGLDEVQLNRFSSFLRKRHLDELPQLYAVVLGRMSLVGPRPKMPDEFEPVDKEYSSLRTVVPQGCTCLWQVGVHTAGLPSDSPEYDYWYLRHWSMRLDIWILWRTALTLLGVGRDIALEDIPVWMVGRRFQVPGLAYADATQAELDRRLLSA
jgi:UDP-GlcNAc:undecaprenyl-phosphate GlcNAc-1-phosphate transferase